MRPLRRVSVTSLPAFISPSGTASEAFQAGNTPQRSVATADTITVKTNTRVSGDASSRRGTCELAADTMTDIAQEARSAPSNVADKVRMKLSARELTIKSRLRAPSATMIARSRARRAARTRLRFATL